MGIKTVTWAPSGRWVAIGGWDNKVRIVESEGWRCVGLMSWGGRVNDKTVVSLSLKVLLMGHTDMGKTVWREPSDWIKDTRGRGIVQCTSRVKTDLWVA
jgi:hypothetical protein